MNAAILTIGDELLQGFTVDTNSSWLGQILLPYDIHIRKKISVGDDVEAIKIQVQNLIDSKLDYIFVTGGLGPTHDDITKEAFRQLFDDEYYLDEDYYQLLKSRFEKRIKKMPENNKSQAMVLKQADSIPNENGSALGLHYHKNESHIFIMPGVPGEMKGMVNNHIIPGFLKKTPQAKQVTIKTAGVMESKLAEQVQDLIEEYKSTFKFAFLPHYTGVSFRINLLDTTANLKQVSEKFTKAMAPFAYGLNEDKLEEVLGQALRKKNLTIATAESCTGGLIGKRLSDVGGSSKYYAGTVTAYSNEVKQSVLGVLPETLDKFGAVSSEVALEMAKGIREKTQADIGLATTGISGPTGGTKTKPVGLVYIALITPQNSKVKQYNLNFGRKIHREMTATAALNITRLSLNE